MSTNNINDNSFVQGMTENVSLTMFADESSDKLDSGVVSTGKMDNPGISGASKLMGPKEAIRNAELNQRVPNTNLRGAAQPGKDGFFSAIKKFFTNLFSKSEPALRFPSKVRVTVAGQKIEIAGERLRGMVEALPMSEREGALKILGKVISKRLGDAEALLKDILNGNPKPEATTQDAADLMLFIQLRHEAMHPKESFTNGAYSVEDPEGRLVHFLDSCRQGYNRSSSHLSGLQNELLSADEHNAMRGIDIPGGVKTGLFDKRSTIHYGSIPKQDNVDGSVRRLFIKAERNGCRVSLRSFKFWTKEFWVNTSGRPHRASTLSDIASSFKHALDYFENSGAKFGIHYRSEKLRGLRPKDIAEAFKDIDLCKTLKALAPYFKADGSQRLAGDARLAKTLNWLSQVEVVAQNEFNREIESLSRNAPKNAPDFASLQRDVKAKYQDFFLVLTSIKSTLINHTYIENRPHEVWNFTDKPFSEYAKAAELLQPDRLGNEVMMRLADLAPDVHVQPRSEPDSQNNAILGKTISDFMNRQALPPPYHEALEEAILGQIREARLSTDGMLDQNNHLDLSKVPESTTLIEYIKFNLANREHIKSEDFKAIVSASIKELIEDHNVSIINDIFNQPTEQDRALLQTFANQYHIQTEGLKPSSWIPNRKLVKESLVNKQNSWFIDIPGKNPCELLIQEAKQSINQMLIARFTTGPFDSKRKEGENSTLPSALIDKAKSQLRSEFFSSTEVEFKPIDFYLDKLVKARYGGNPRRLYAQMLREFENQVNDTNAVELFARLIKQNIKEAYFVTLLQDQFPQMDSATLQKAMELDDVQYELQYGDDAQAMQTWLAVNYKVIQEGVGME